MNNSYSYNTSTMYNIQHPFSTSVQQQAQTLYNNGNSALTAQQTHNTYTLGPSNYWSYIGSGISTSIQGTYYSYSISTEDSIKTLFNSLDETQKNELIKWFLLENSELKHIL